jgi:glycosyltransferase involved in cell wall biosynthesis
MAKGKHPIAYFADPHIDKPREAIYAELDGFTDEVFAQDTARHAQISMFALLPPLRYRGRFVKGILATQAADLLLERNPKLQESFHVLAYAMWSGLPHCKRADGVMMCYDNAHREAWVKQTQPDRAHQVWIPHDDTDLFDDQQMAPQFAVKDVDVLCVARLDRIKNLHILAQAAKVLRERNPKRHLRIVLNTGTNVDVNWTGLHEAERNELRRINAVLINTPDYITVLPSRQAQLSALYNRARCVVMPALCEGKNRSIHEAMSCNVPVVTFAAFNQYARNGVPPFPPEAGLVAPEFSAQSLADTLEKVLAETERFTPREAVLRVSGRRTALTSCIDRLPYYKEQLPDFTPGAHLNNTWIDVAMQLCYRRGLHQHLYNFGKADGAPAMWHKGLEECERSLAAYCKIGPNEPAASGTPPVTGSLEG